MIKNIIACDEGCGIMLRPSFHGRESDVIQLCTGKSRVAVDKNLMRFGCENKVVNFL